MFEKIRQFLADFGFLKGWDKCSVRQDGLLALSECKPGVYTVKWNCAENEIRDYIDDFGLCAGGRLTLVSSYNGGVIVRVNDRRIALGRDTACRIKV